MLAVLLVSICGEQVEGTVWQWLSAFKVCEQIALWILTVEHYELIKWCCLICCMVTVVTHDHDIILMSTYQSYSLLLT